MRSWKAVGLTLAAAATLASPLAAQHRESTAERIAREVREAAEGIRTVRDAVDESVDNVRFRGRDRWAIDRCGPSVERYGRMHVDDVRRYKRRSLRVYGTVGGEAYGGRYDARYGRYDGYRMRSFTCTVYDDGRVKLKTKRLRR